MLNNKMFNDLMRLYRTIMQVLVNERLVNVQEVAKLETKMKERRGRIGK